MLRDLRGARGRPQRSHAVAKRARSRSPSLARRSAAPPRTRRSSIASAMHAVVRSGAGPSRLVGAVRTLRECEDRSERQSGSEALADGDPPRRRCVFVRSPRHELVGEPERGLGRIETRLGVERANAIGSGRPTRGPFRHPVAGRGCEALDERRDRVGQGTVDSPIESVQQAWIFAGEQEAAAPVRQCQPLARRGFGVWRFAVVLREGADEVSEIEGHVEASGVVARPCGGSTQPQGDVPIHPTDP